MALPRSWEELNEEVGFEVSEPIDEYFKPMRISKQQKEKRESLAYDLEDAVSGLLVYAFYAKKNGVALAFDELNQLSVEQVRATSRENPVVRAREEYLDAVCEWMDVDEHLIGHVDETLIAALLVLMRHAEEPYYYSADRARAIAENDSNAVWDYDENREAHNRGFRYKTWHTIMDGKQRDSHSEVNGLTIPIDEPFLLRGGYLMYPHDSSLGVSESELSNCRCSISYS